MPIHTENAPAASQPARVIYLLKMFPRFSETFILNEILGLEALGVDVRIYSLKRPNDGKFHAELARLRARVRYVPEYATANIGDFLPRLLAVMRDRPGAFLSTLGEAVAALNPYAVKRWMQAVWLSNELRDDPHTGVHCHFALSAPRVAYFLRKLNGNPYTFTAHAKDIYLKSTKRWLLRRKIEESRGVVTVCDFNRNYLLAGHAKGLGDRIVRIYNGIDLDAFTPADPARRREGVILSVSRLVPKKGVDVLLKACAELRQRGIAFECRICGEGSERPALERLAAELGLGESVVFLGMLPQTEVRRELSECTLLAAPSMEAADGNLDALPTSLIEAIATGTPCVSTTVTGIPEIVTDGEQGLLVAPGDEGALADALERLLHDPVMRAEMARKGRERAHERFDRHLTIRELASFLAKAHAPPAQPVLHVGYVLTVFPRLSETFILREIRELESLGARVTVYSQKRPVDAKVHAEAREVRAHIVYLGPWWRAGHRVVAAHLWLLLHSNSRYAETLRFLLSRRNMPTAKKFWRSALVARDAQRTGVQLLHSHFLSGNTRLARLAAQLCGLPYSLTAHAKDIYAAGLSERKMARRLEGASFVATISALNCEYLRSKAPTARVELIPNSVRPAEFEYRERAVRDPASSLRVLAIGRLVAKKGFGVLVEACRQLRDSGVAFEARVVGEGPEQEWLARQIAQAGLADHMHLTGSKTQQELRADFEWADVLVVPSVPAPDGDIDGVPVVILEAMAFGVPVIASRLSGIPEVVLDGTTGVLVEPGSALTLAEALRQARGGAMTRQAAAARHRIETDYDLAVNARRLLELMRGAVEAAP